jgi:hypothetical protein
VTEEETIPLRSRITMLGLSCLVTLACAEGLVRFVDDGAMPMIHLFESTEDGGIRLTPGEQMKITRAGEQPWTLAISTAGFRAETPEAPAPGPGRWLAVGDSQVLGSGVAVSEAFPALAQVDGQPMVNAGVPGYGVADAIQRAENLLDTLQPSGVVVLINQMNDWEETSASVGQRYVVRGGWLLDREDDGTLRSDFLASPLSRSHIFFLVGQLALRDWSAPPPAPPAWMVQPEAQSRETLHIARQVQAFAARHPTVRVLPVYLPADIYATEERLGESPLSAHVDGLQTPPWTDRRLRDAILLGLTGLRPLDLSPVLAGRADHFLTRDYHLSPSGQAAVAAAIVAHIEDGASQ